jgi:hypothetical protein
MTGPKATHAGGPLQRANPRLARRLVHLTPNVRPASSARLVWTARLLCKATPAMNVCESLLHVTGQTCTWRPGLCNLWLCCNFP